MDKLNNGPEPNQAEPTIKHQECASSLKNEADTAMKCENSEQGKFDATRNYGHRAEEAQVKAGSTKNSYGDAQVTGPHTNVVDDEAESTSTSYLYSPLDRTQNTIRLVRVLPELSTEGFIECDIWHDTIEAQYTTLSYVWGSERSEEGQSIILLNTKQFKVRKNLFDFLRVAQRKYAMLCIWIDALCIDQSSILERNHQVGQMSQIYTMAESVISWFGHSHGIESALRFCAEIPMRLGGGQLRLNNSLDFRRRLTAGLEALWAARPSEIVLGWNELQEHQYWKRAWVRIDHAANISNACPD